MFVQEHQFDGTEWRKSNLIFGYHDIWDENMGGTATGATYTKSSAAIPAGELWILQAISVRDDTRDVTAVNCMIGRASGGSVVLAEERPAARYVPALATGQFTLRTGDTAVVSVAGCQAGDTITAGLVGYKMKLDM